jgi:acyl carrier protein
MDVRETLRMFITVNLMSDSRYKLGDDEALISGGLIDSFSLVELQLFIERQFGVRIDDTELTVEKINCLNDIVTLVQTRQ